MVKQEIQETKEEKMERELETIEKFPRTRKLEGKLYYEIVSRKKTISCIFLNLVNNIQKYDKRGI